MSTSESKKWMLHSSDGETFEVDEAAASLSVLVKHMIEDLAGEDSVRLPNVKGNVLAKVIEYCKKHVGIPSDAGADVTEELKRFDAEFVNVDFNALFDLVLAANYLNIPALLDITCQAVADNIKDKQPEEVRRIFNIENDFTEEEEKQIREENKWAYEV